MYIQLLLQTMWTLPLGGSVRIMASTLGQAISLFSPHIPDPRNAWVPGTQSSVNASGHMDEAGLRLIIAKRVSFHSSRNLSIYYSFFSDFKKGVNSTKSF